MIQKINHNNGRLFLVGDIHGMFTLLENLLDKSKFEPSKDILISVGDLVDRGPESYRVLEFLEYKWFYSVLGNHEQMMIDLLNQENQENQKMWELNGGLWENKNIPYSDFSKRFESLPLAIEINYKGKKIGVNHSGIPMYFSDWNEYIKDLSFSDEDSEVYSDTLWSRRTFYKAKMGSSINIDNIDLIVSGHTPNKEIIYDENQLFIDTGAFCSLKNFNCGQIKGKLTMIEIIVENDNLSFITI